MSFAVQMQNISKSYQQVQANKNVELKVEAGKIHALVGENGAGKTTLMNILFGLEEADSGNIKIFDKDTEITSPKDAFALGIGMVHQHFKLVPSLSVQENIFLGNEKKRGLFIDKEKQKKEVLELSEKFSLDVDPEAKIENLSVGLRQRVEILKALHKGAKIIILDEPTAVLTPQEATELFTTIRKFVEEDGITIIFISHHMDEIMTVSDNITVLRQGKTVATLETKSTNKEELAMLMIGHSLPKTKGRGQRKSDEIILRVDNLWARNDIGLHALKGISFEVKKNEIVGIAGVAGNGQTELAETISGLRKTSYGNIFLDGTQIEDKNSHYIRSLGFSHVPSDRMQRGCDSRESIKSNMIMGLHDKEPFCQNKIILNKKYIDKYSSLLIEEYAVKTSNSEVAIGTLSGGNIQKVIVARELYKNSRFILVDQPTRGIDIASSNFIHNKIIQARDDGKAVLLISMQLDEIMLLSDRILVMFDGNIVGIVDPKKTTEEEIGLLMTGSIK